MSPSPSGRRTIGAVLADLREEFPDVTVSKIRFLESEGLLDPERTPSGYRMYAANDVARLRYILTAQRDRFWPLKVIREALDGLDRGLEPVDVPGTAERPRPPAVREDPDVATVDEFTTISKGPAPRLTAAELAASAGGDIDLITQLAAYGLLRADRKGYFSGESARVVAAAANLGRFGIEARHLRPFRTAADREVGLIDYATESAQRPSAAQVVSACLALHTALVKDQLGASNGRAR